MTPELKARWLTGLRSGEYIQGQGFLRRGDAHCAIGVLCEVAGGFSFKPANNDLYPGLFVVDGPDGLGASHYVTECLIGEDEYQALVRMNDEGRTFADIADYIERAL